MGNVKMLERVMRRVWSSPFSLLTWRYPSAPDPPGLLTTWIRWGMNRRFSTTSAMSRAMRSAPPPSPAGTTILTGLEGDQGTAAWIVPLKRRTRQERAAALVRQAVRDRAG